MPLIEINAEKWKTSSEFYDALLSALGSPEGHGRSIDAAIDSMIWGEMNAIDPPYLIRIDGLAKLPRAVRREIEDLKEALSEARAEYRSVSGRDIEVGFEIRE